MIKGKIIDEACKGCRDFEEARDLSNMVCTIMNPMGYCPCKKCIVKSMCVNPCKEFIRICEHNMVKRENKND